MSEVLLGLDGKCRARGLRRAGAACLVAVMAVAVLPAGAASARQPVPGDFLEYYFARNVGSGTGEYEEYSDATYSIARLEILSVSATDVQVRSTYNWTYSSNEGDHDDGLVDRTVSFGLADRHWTSTLTDDDDHDGKVAADLAAWFWIPTDHIQVGDRFDAVDDTFTVVSLRSTVWSNGLPRVGIEMHAEGGFNRNDAYGEYWVTYSDTFYYDAATGYVIAERYSETDRGTYGGDPAGFTWTESVDVTASSYPIEVDVVALGLNLGAIGAFVGFLTWSGYRIRWRTRKIDTGIGTVRIERLWRKNPSQRLIDANVRAGEKCPSPNFSRFLGDFARKGLAAGDRVAVAHQGGEIVGLGVLSRDSNVGQVFARPTTVAEPLRRFIGARDFFSEFKHEVPHGAVEAAAESGVPMSSGDAYNIMDTYLVLRLEGAGAGTYDAALVQRMRPQDLPAVKALAGKVYKVRCDKWLDAQLATGDVGFVARVEGKLVGFAFAGLVGNEGRLHTLTVDPQFRNRGIGRELVRARLHALRALGATSVVTEIAAWNVPSLQLAFSHGFAKVDTMWVETTRRRRAKFGLQRR